MGLMILQMREYQGLSLRKLHTIASYPQKFQEFFGVPEWHIVMHEDSISLERNHTWDLVPFPKGRNFI